jgi:hypothetical protein
MIAIFFMLGWDRYGFDEKRAGTRFTEVVFLHRVGSAGHIGQSGVVSMKSVLGHVTPNLCFCVSDGICVSRYGVSGVQNVITLFFILRWDRYGFGKKCTGTYIEFVFLHPVGSAGHVGQSGASGA